MTSLTFFSSIPRGNSLLSLSRSLSSRCHSHRNQFKSYSNIPLSSFSPLSSSLSLWYSSSTYRGKQRGNSSRSSSPSPSHSSSPSYSWQKESSESSPSPTTRTRHTSRYRSKPSNSDSFRSNSNYSSRITQPSPSFRPSYSSSSAVSYPSSSSSSPSSSSSRRFISPSPHLYSSSHSKNNNKIDTRNNLTKKSSNSSSSSFLVDVDSHVDIDENSEMKKNFQEFYGEEIQVKSKESDTQKPKINPKDSENDSDSDTTSSSSNEIENNSEKVKEKEKAKVTVSEKRAKFQKIKQNIFDNNKLSLHAATRDPSTPSPDDPVSRFSRVPLPIPPLSSYLSPSSSSSSSSSLLRVDNIKTNANSVDDTFSFTIPSLEKELNLNSSTNSVLLSSPSSVSPSYLLSSPSSSPSLSSFPSPSLSLPSTLKVSLPSYPISSAPSSSSPIPPPSLLHPYPSSISSFTFLGTSSGSPTPHRNTSSLLLSLHNNSSMLIDCGEGSFSQLLRYDPHFPIHFIDVICITHMHLDHTLGIFGMVMNCYWERKWKMEKEKKSQQKHQHNNNNNNNNNANESPSDDDIVVPPITIIAPEPLSSLLTAIFSSSQVTLPPIHFLPLHSHQLREIPSSSLPPSFHNIKITAVPIPHTVPSFSFVIEERGICPQVAGERGKKLGISKEELDGIVRGEIKMVGKEIIIKGKDIVPKEISTTTNIPSEYSKYFSFLSSLPLFKLSTLWDTNDSFSSLPYSHSSTVSIHESTFSTHDGDIATQMNKGHSSPIDAINYAVKSQSKHLILTHFGKKYSSMWQHLSENPRGRKMGEGDHQVKMKYSSDGQIHIEGMEREAKMILQKMGKEKEIPLYLAEDFDTFRVVRKGDGIDIQRTERRNFMANVEVVKENKEEKKEKDEDIDMNTTNEKAMKKESSSPPTPSPSPSLPSSIVSEISPVKLSDSKRKRSVSAKPKAKVSAKDKDKDKDSTESASTANSPESESESSDISPSATEPKGKIKTQRKSKSKILKE